MALEGFSSLTPGTTELPSKDVTSENKLSLFGNRFGNSQINHPQLSGLVRQKCSEVHTELELKALIKRHDGYVQHRRTDVPCRPVTPWLWQQSLAQATYPVKETPKYLQNTHKTNVTPKPDASVALYVKKTKVLSLFIL